VKTSLLLVLVACVLVACGSAPRAPVAASITQSAAVPSAAAPPACPVPDVPDATLTAFRDPAGECADTASIVRYRCGEDVAPVVLVDTGNGPAEYLGDGFATRVAKVPSGATLVGSTERGARVYRSGAALFVVRADGVRRWPRIAPRSQGGATVTGLYRPSAFFVGDSVMLGAKVAIESALRPWHVTVDAVVGRSTVAGLEVLPARRNAIRDVAVVQLGTNDGASLAPYALHVDEIMRELRDVPVVIWLTIREARRYYAGTNATLRRTLRAYPNAFVADWNAYAPAPGMYGDGLHLRPSGAAAMARLVHDAILAADGVSLSAGLRTLADANVPVSDRDCRSAVLRAGRADGSP
jgi:hypothetical protein